MEFHKKRERSTNFTKSEVRLLVELVAKYSLLIENKKTDAVSNRNKEEAWTKIANLFNRANGESNRNAKTLKLKYEGLKKETKKKISKHMQEMYYKTGEPSTAPPLDKIDEKVLSICSNFTGLESLNDSDNIQAMLEVEQEKIDFDASAIANDESCDMTEDCKQDVNQHLNITLSNDENNGSIENKRTSWNPQALKNISRNLDLNIRNMSSNQLGVKNNDALTSAQLELVRLQTIIAKKEHEFVLEEHKIKMLHLSNEEKRKQEIHNLILSKMQSQSDVLDVSLSKSD